MTFLEFYNDVTGRVLPDGDSSRLTNRHKNWVKDCLIDIQKHAVCRQTGHTEAYSFDETEYECESSIVDSPAGIVTAVLVENVEDSCDYVAAREVTENVFRGALANVQLCACATPADAVEKPVASVVTGTYYNDQSVTLNCATAGASIFWSADDGDGLTDFAAYTGAITISATGTTLRFYATKLSLPDSALGSEIYTLRVATPVLNPNGFTFYPTTGVTSSTSTTGATQRYTTNLTTPTSSSTLYSGAITVSATTTITIKGFKTGYEDSATDTETYTIDAPPVSPVTFLPTTPTFIGVDSITMATTTPAPYEIRYTTNGSDPTAASTLYSGAVSINADTLFKAKAFKTGYSNIAASSMQYTLLVPQVDPVTYTPTSNQFINTVNVSMATATSGASIYYALGGATPTTSSTLYTGPITVTADQTIKAIAVKTYYTNSAVTTKTLTEVVPQTLFLSRTAPASVFLNEPNYTAAQLTVTIGSHTHLYIEIDGSAVTYDFIYDGATLFGTQNLGADGTDANPQATHTATLSGNGSTILLGVGADIATNPAYFRSAGNPYSEINVRVYSY